jgi:hypothetical protein
LQSSSLRARRCLTVGMGSLRLASQCVGRHGGSGYKTVDSRMLLQAPGQPCTPPYCGWSDGMLTTLENQVSGSPPNRCCECC